MQATVAVFLGRSILSDSCSFHWDPITAFSLCPSRVGVGRQPTGSPSLRVLHYPTLENTRCTPVSTWSVAILSVLPPHLPIETHDVQFQLGHECKMFHHLIMNHTRLPWQWHRIKDIVHFCANGFKLILECVAINLHVSCLPNGHLFFVKSNSNCKTRVMNSNCKTRVMIIIIILLAIIIIIVTGIYISCHTFLHMCFPLYSYKNFMWCKKSYCFSPDFIDGKMGSTETPYPPHKFQNLVKVRRHLSSHLSTLLEEMRWLK